MDLIYLPYFNNVLQLVAAIVATVSFNRYRRSNERYFLFFLWYIFIVDVVAGVLGDVFLLNNFWLYNVHIVISFLFYFNWYHSVLRRRKFKKTVVVFTMLFGLVALYSGFMHSWEKYHTYTFFTGAIFLLVLTLFHFYQLLNSDEVLVVKYKLSFWISTALLLFYMGMIPIIFLMEYTNIRVFSYLIIIISLNVILYGCYIIGFLWTKKEYNRF